jgi:hypothetical protein
LWHAINHLLCDLLSSAPRTHISIGPHYAAPFFLEPIAAADPSTSLKHSQTGAWLDK